MADACNINEMTTRIILFKSNLNYSTLKSNKIYLCNFWSYAPEQRQQVQQLLDKDNRRKRV